MLASFYWIHHIHGMNRIIMYLLVFGVLAGGCASNSDYGLEADPVIKAAEGKSSSGSLRENITKENTRAREEGDEPIFQVEDNH